MFFNIYLYKRITLSSDVYKHLLSRASSYSKKSILQKCTYKEKCASLIDDFLLSELIYKNYRFRYDNDEIITNKFGKPLFKNQKNCYFNFSHNDKYGVLVLGEQPVGVDVEEIENVNIKTKVVFLSDRELYSKYSTKLSLCKLWTAKESYCKATGYGLNISLNEIDVTKLESNFIVSYGKESHGWFVKHVVLPGKTVIAVCSNNQFLLKHNKVNLAEFLSGIIK
jgi:4'-phosphopantetheinyl transferase